MAFITLAQAKTHLNMSAATHDVELQLFVNDACKAIVSRIGTVEATPGASVRIRGGGSGLAFPTSARVVSVQSVTPVAGSAIDPSLLYIDEMNGVIEHDDGSVFTARAYDVIYTAGFATVPDDLVHAALDMVKHMWESQRGPTVRPGSGGASQKAEDDFAHDERVRELLAPYRSVGFA